MGRPLRRRRAGPVARADGDDVQVLGRDVEQRKRRWAAQYKDANGKQRGIGLFDTQEEAARAHNAAIRRAGLEGSRKTNPVVDGQLVPRVRKMTRKRRRDEPAATPPTTRVRN